MTDINYERILLGAALLYPGVVNNVTVDPTDFADTRYARLWTLMADMAARDEAVNPATVLSALTRIPKQDRVGIDGPHLHKLLEEAPYTANEGELAARELTDEATFRRMGIAGRRIIQLSESGGDAAAMHELARAELDAAHRVTSHIAPVGDTIDDTIESFDLESEAIPTPWDDLNYLINGWEPGHLYVLGARPGVGKSIVGLQAAVGMTDHGAVAFHSLEMSKREIDQRLIAQLAEVPLGRLKGRSKTSQPPTERDWQKIASVRGRVADMPLYVDDNPSVGITDIRANARTLARRGNLVGVVVDYLQLIEAPTGDYRPRQEFIAEVSRKLKNLAKELHVPVIAIVQLNREVTKRQNGLPSIADIRESGAIEQDANVIILLHAEEGSTDLDMGVGKNRSGPQGAVKLTRRGEFARLEPRQWRPAHHQYPN